MRNWLNQHKGRDAAFILTLVQTRLLFCDLQSSINRLGKISGTGVGIIDGIDAQIRQNVTLACKVAGLNHCTAVNLAVTTAW